LKKVVFLFIFFKSALVFSQSLPKELKKLESSSLFDLTDSLCLNVEGEWTGEEIQYDPTASFVKSKFKVVFKLVQEGNKITGTSFIQDKYRGSYGEMKIRGVVLGSKLYFEEYEILDEKWYKKNYVWCLRSGEMDIRSNDHKGVMEGLHYDGYASDSYFKCTDYVKMSLNKDAAGEVKPSSFKNKKAEEKFDVFVSPNPFSDQTTLTYEVKKQAGVRVEIFSLSGSLIQNVVNEQQLSGPQTSVISLTEHAPGVYLIRVIIGDGYCTKQIVKTK
jgi:hypothetical protein